MKKETMKNAQEHKSDSPLDMDRRQFLKRFGLLGGGLIIYAAIGDTAALAQRRRSNLPTDFNAFLRIGANGRVTCLTGKIEMGQGPITSLPQMLADELDVAYESVDIVMGDTDLCPWDGGTFGSLSTRVFGVFLREAASEAKGVLKELAAERLMVPVERLQTSDGVVFDKDRPRSRVSYAMLTKGKVIERHLSNKPTLKQVSEFKVMGKSYLRQDAYEKVTGKAQYAGDIRLPGMLYAKILRPPAHGAKLKRVDTTGAENIRGVRVIRDREMIAVLHELPDVAEKGLAAIQAEYDRPRTGVDDKTIFEHLLKNAPSPRIASEAGDLKIGERDAKTIIEETYYNSYVAHSPIEPHTSLAKMENGKLTVWASTQSPFRVQSMVARALGMKPEKVRIITPFVGGGFGGKTSSQQSVEAARLAKITGRPVQVAWSRAEEIFYDSFRPAAVVKIKSGLNAAGDMVLWDYNVYFAGRRGCEIFYDIPHHREAVYGEWRIQPGIHPFDVGPWRAPAANTNVYARDLHINLTAAKAGVDPLEFRLKHLKDKRMTRVLKAAAEKFGWQPSPPPSGRGQGIACGIDAETFVASMAEVEVDKTTGNVQVKRVVCAQDMGIVVNPQGATIQMEGCINMGLGYAFTEEIRFKDGEIFDKNFDTYSIPTFSWIPEIETVIVNNPDLPPKGGGEPAIINMGGIIATAIFDATGAKLMQLPMTPERVKAALNQV